MPRGRSTFTKRQKEHARQQRQRDKAERKNQRRQEKPVDGSVDEMAELREHAAEQAALFNIGVEETETAEESMPGGIDEWLVIASLPEPNALATKYGTKCRL
jgi:sRNA-binding protein